MIVPGACSVRQYNDCRRSSGANSRARPVWSIPGSTSSIVGVDDGISGAANAEVAGANSTATAKNNQNMVTSLTLSSCFDGKNGRFLTSHIKPQSMSALGQKRTYAVQKGMSALPPKATVKADIAL